jgi:hypothetical protein
VRDLWANIKTKVVETFAGIDIGEKTMAGLAVLSEIITEKITG